MTPAPIDFGRAVLRFDGPAHIMGIVNCTPDSFSDGGLHLDPDRAIEAALAMVEDGASILDVGGESTRPGADAVSLDEELRRTIPVIEGIRRACAALISIDTTKAEVARAAIQAGADIVNDVSGMTLDPTMANTVAETGAAAILMHMRGTPRTMQRDTVYGDIADEVADHLRARVESAVAAGVKRARIIVDPGIGFGKDVKDNLRLIRRAHLFGAGGQAVLIGPSRKSFIGRLLDIDDPTKRQWGTAGAVAAAVCCGAHIVRVHDVAPMLQAVRIAEAIARA